MTCQRREKIKKKGRKRETKKGGVAQRAVFLIAPSIEVLDILCYQTCNIKSRSNTVKLRALKKDVDADCKASFDAVKAASGAVSAAASAAASTAAAMATASTASSAASTAASTACTVAISRNLIPATSSAAFASANLSPASTTVVRDAAPPSGKDTKKSAAKARRKAQLDEAEAKWNAYVEERKAEGKLAFPQGPTRAKLSEVKCEEGEVDRVTGN